MELERRRVHRASPEQLSYILFEPEGGGIVLNASEQGLAFHAAGAMRQPGAIRLCLSPNPMWRIELTAEIVWMDETKKCGGLRFTEFTTDATNQIREWLTHTSEPETADKKFAGRSCALMEETDPGPHERSITPYLAPVTHALANATPMLPDVWPTSIARFSAVPTKALRPDSFSPKKGNTSSRPRWLDGLAAGLLTVAFGFVPFLFRPDFRREAGNSLIRLGEKLKGDRDSPIPAQVSNPRSESSPPVPNPIPATPTREVSDQSEPTASAQVSRGETNSASSRPADRQNSGEHFVDARSRGGRNVLARQLWSAIGAGDTSAEFPLAQLYLKGDGVPRNCDQARILLRASSRSGNIEATRQLEKLKRSDCR
jgi:hypothetical protein